MTIYVYFISLWHLSQPSRFLPTSDLVCIKMTSILNSKSCDLKHSNTFSNHHEVIILSMKSVPRLKDQVKGLVYEMLIDRLHFHRLFNSVLKVVLSFFSGVLHGKSTDFLLKNVRCRCISSFVIQPRDWSPDHPNAACGQYGEIFAKKGKGL